MTTKLMEFKRNLHEFLLLDNISTESNVVNDLVFKMAGIEFSENHRDLGFDFSNYQYNREKDNIQFSLPKLPMKQLKMLLNFFNIPEDEYITNKPLVLDAAFVFETFLPAFKNHYQTLKDHHPEVLVPYRIKSRAILESSAVSTLEEYTKKVISTIMDGSMLESNRIVDAMLLLKGKVEFLRSQPVFYKSIIETAQSIHDFLDLPEVLDNPQLARELRLVSEGIGLFASYHRNESVIAVRNFMQEMEKFLNIMGITASQCNIVEDTLLRLVETKPVEDCKYSTGSDHSRLVFKFYGMDKESAAQVVRFLQNMGDETATEGYGQRQYGSSVPESMHRRTVAQSSGPHYISETIPESHSIEVDGKFLYETLFPALKSAIQNTGEDILETYKNASKVWLDKKAAVDNLRLSDKKDALFQPAPGVFHADDIGVIFNMR